MFHFLIDSMFIEFGGHVFQETLGILMVNNCDSLLDDMFLYSYEAEFNQLFTERKKNGTRAFNFHD